MAAVGNFSLINRQSFTMK